MSNHWQHYQIRPARADDLDGVLCLSTAGGHMLTTLPADKDVLDKRIKRSIHAFYPEVSEPGNESYTFLLEDTRTGALHGISGLQAKTGGFQPFYTYERVRAENRYAPLGIEQSIERLECRTWHDGPSELGSLYLLPEARGKGVGKLLSFSRLLFMSAFSQRFEDEVIAEIRGWQDEAGVSPFWKNVIEPFFGSEFQQMDAFSGTGDKAFLRALLPKYPIYCDLLPETVRSIIGRAHSEAEPAKQLLLRLGFSETDYVDVFDAGPMIRACLDDLPFIKEGVSVRQLNRQEKDANTEGPVGILSNGALDFRAVLVGNEPDAEGCLEIPESQLAVFEPYSDNAYTFYPLKRRAA